MDFADITHIDDVLPHIKEKPEIVVIDADGYWVIDYTFVTPTTFDNPYTLECRGLKFDRDGKIIARPLHKFFNLGERQKFEDIDWSIPFEIQEKRDGSMVHTVTVNGETMFMTRRGLTPQAKAAWAFASDELKETCREFCDLGFTLIFEYTAPDNRVVLEYQEPSLTLLAWRDFKEGYGSYGDLDDMPNPVDWAPVLPNDEENLDEYFARLRKEEGIEGVVVEFLNGHRLKIKTDDYVRRHNGAEKMSREKDVLQAILDNTLDDFRQLLSDDHRAAIDAYEESVDDAWYEAFTRVRSLHNMHKHKERKDFATAVKNELPPLLHGAAFAVYGGGDEGLAIWECLRKQSVTQAKIDEAREVFGFEWKGNNK